MFLSGSQSRQHNTTHMFWTSVGHSDHHCNGDTAVLQHPRTRDAKYPAVTKEVPHKEELYCQNVDSTPTEKPWSLVCVLPILYSLVGLKSNLSSLGNFPLTLSSHPFSGSSSLVLSLVLNYMVLCKD